MPLTPKAIKDLQAIPSSGVLLANLFFEVNRRLSPTLWAGDSESISGDTLASLLLASGAAVNINLIQRLNPKGAYSAATTYSLYDFVKLNGVNYAYIASGPSSGNSPPNASYWTEISEDGISGNKIWFVTAAPAASLGAVDDAAIQDDGKIYKKTSTSTWTLMFDAANAADISAALAAHEAASDPQPIYLTQAEGDFRYPLLSTLSETIDDRVAALIISGTNTTPQYNDPANTLQINAVGGSSGGGGASGIQYTYNPTAGAGRISAADLSIATSLDINAADAQGKGAGDVLARIKTGAIINLAKDATHWVRYAVTADYVSGAVTVTVAQFLGAIVSGDTVYLSIVSDAPSTSVGGTGVLDNLATAASETLVANSRTISDSSTAQLLTLPLSGLRTKNIVIGKGLGVWTILGGTIVAPSGASNNAVRRLATHRYAHVELECIDAGSNKWLIINPSDLTGLELIDPSPLDPDTDSYASGLSIAPDAYRLSALNNFVTASKIAGVWGQITGLWVNLAKTPGDVLKTVKGGDLVIASGGAIDPTEIDPLHGYLPNISRYLSFTPQVDSNQSLGFFVGVQKAPNANNQIRGNIGTYGTNGVQWNVGIPTALAEFPNFGAGSATYENNLTGYFGESIQFISPGGISKIYKNGTIISTGDGMIPPSPAVARFTVGTVGGVMSLFLFFDNPPNAAYGDSLNTLVSTLSTSLAT